MKPYCQDLRKRILAKAKVGNQTQAIIVVTSGVSLSTVEKWWRRQPETDNTMPLLPPHGLKRILQDYAPFLRVEVKKQPDITPSELSAVVTRQIGVEVSPSTVSRELQRLHLPRKKPLHDILRDNRRIRGLCRPANPSKGV